MLQKEAKLMRVLLKLKVEMAGQRRERRGIRETMSEIYLQPLLSAIMLHLLLMILILLMLLTLLKRYQVGELSNQVMVVET